MNLNKFFQKIKNISIFSVYCFLIGLYWIILHLFIRFVMHRPTYVLAEIKPYLTFKYYLVFNGFIMWHIILVFVTIFIIYRQKYPSKKQSFFIVFGQKFQNIVDYVYWKPLQYIFDIIVPRLPLIGSFFLYVEKIWTEKMPKYFYTLIFLFEILPRLLIVLIFLTEIMVFGQIKIFFWSLMLIIIPISWQIFLKMFDFVGTLNRPTIKYYFSEIKGINPIFEDKHKTISYEAWEYTLKPEYEHLDPDEEFRLLLQLASMSEFAEKLREDTVKIMPYVTIVTSLLYIIGGSYRLVLLL